MAATWRVVAAAVTRNQAQISVVDVFNGAASARVLRCYRAWLWNNGSSVVTSGHIAHMVARITAATGGTSLTPVKHDTTTGALDAATTAGTKRLVTHDRVLRLFAFGPEEPQPAEVGLRNWELLVPNAEVWNSGYADPNVQPAVLRPGYGISIHVTRTILVQSNTVNGEIEFTDAGS